MIGVVLFKNSEDFKFRPADIDVSQEANESMDQAEPSQSKQYGQFQKLLERSFCCRRLTASLRKPTNTMLTQTEPAYQTF